MRGLTFAAGLFLALAFGMPAAALQVRPETDLPIARDCGATFGGDARPIAYDADEVLPEARRSGLSAGVYLALRDATGARTWPEPQIEAAPPCPIARFDADGQTWTISAGSGAAPARWIRANGREDYFFLARGPSPDEAADWAGDRSAGFVAKQTPAYYLAAVGMGLRFVFRIYDGPPDNRRLADDLAEIIPGRSAPLAVYDPGGEAVTVLRPTASGRTAELFQPGLVHGLRTATLYGADGRFFASDAGEAVVMRGSNLPCAPSYGVFTRDRLFVLDAREESLDLACRLAAGDSWITVFSTRVPDPKADRQIILERMTEAQSSGVARRLKAPRTGPRQALQAGGLWVDREGAGQAIWFMRRGEYLIELRATFALDLQQSVLDVLGPISQGRLPAVRVSGEGPA